jgi:hypothetical protein
MWFTSGSHNFTTQCQNHSLQASGTPLPARNDGMCADESRWEPFEKWAMLLKLDCGGAILNE